MNKQVHGAVAVVANARQAAAALNQALAAAAEAGIEVEVRVLEHQQICQRLPRVRVDLEMKKVEYL